MNIISDVLHEKWRSLIYMGETKFLELNNKFSNCEDLGCKKKLPHLGPTHATILLMMLNDLVAEIYIDSIGTLSHKYYYHDFILGIILRSAKKDEEVVVDIFLQGKSMHKINARRNQILPILPSGILPIFNFQEGLEFYVPEGYYLDYVCGRIRTTDRMFLYNTCIVQEVTNNQYIYSYKGYIKWIDQDSNMEEYKERFELPTWKQEMVRKNKMINAYKEELMKVTWHPDRFIHWCLHVDAYV